MRLPHVNISLRNLTAGFAALQVLGAIAAGVATAADRIELGVFTGSISSPAIIALETGAIAAEDLDVKFVPFGNSAMAATAIVSGDIDIAANSLSAAAYNLAGKGGVRLIAGTIREMPGYEFTAYVVTNDAWKSGIRSPRSLLDHRIGITTVGSPLHFFVSELAVKAGKDPRTLDLVQMQSMSAASAGLQSGKIDGAMLVKALALRAEREGFGRIVGWVGDDTPGPNGVLLASTKALASKRALIERFLRAYRVGAKAYFDTFLRRDAAGQPIKGPDYERFLAMLAQYNGISPGLMAASLAYIDRNARLDVDGVARQIDLGRRLGLVDDNFDPAAIFDRPLLGIK
jgi:NitT/TauT family transport system substrate-binding protein